MFKRLNLLLVLVFSMVAFPVSSVMKPHYGGNARVAEDLLMAISQIRLFESDQDGLKPHHPFPFRTEKNKLFVELSTLPVDRITELEKVVDSLQDESNRCHWILDYPNFGHAHATTVSVEGQQLILETEEPEFLQLLAQSGCLIPQQVSYLLPFMKTQFGYEANTKSILGRPFLDSISPVVVDPMNPYLSFKLGEVDAFLVPEEKFRQISSDDQIQILPGPQFYVFLRSENVTPQQVLSLTSVLDLHEISRAVLNEHAEIYTPQKEAAAAGQPWKTPIYLKVPDDPPFRLIGERIRIQLENGGFVISTKALPQSAPMLEVAVTAVQEADMDLFRYRLLRDVLQIFSDVNWFEEWDDLEASGKILSLLLYESRIAVRKSLIDVHPGAGGIPDFSNAWIWPESIYGVEPSPADFETPSP